MRNVNEQEFAENDWGNLVELAKSLSADEINTNVSNIQPTQFEGSVYDFGDYVINGIIGGEESTNFLQEQFGLHLLNELGGRIFNPLGFISGILADDRGGLTQVATQLLSDVLGGGGAVDTTDGKTFGRVLDNNIYGSFFESAEEFRDATAGGAGGRLLRGVENGVAQAVGASFPVRSILAQALLFDEDSAIASIKDGSSNAIKFEEGLSGVEALNYIYGKDFKLKHPLRWNRLRRQIDSVLGGVQGANYRVQYDQNIADLKPDVNKFMSKTNNRIGAGFNVSLLDTLLSEPIISNWTINESDTPNSRSRDVLSYYTLFFDSNFTDRDISEAKDIFDLAKRDEKKKYGTKISRVDGISIDDTNPWDAMRIYLNDTLTNLEYGVETTDLISGSVQEYNFEDPDEYSPISDAVATDINYPTYNISKKYKKEKTRNYSVLNRIDPLSDVSFFLDIQNDERFNIPDDPVFGLDVLNETDENNARTDLEEYIYMSFTDIRNNQTIFLRPSIEGATTEDLQIASNDVKYIGHTESFPIYDSTNRSLSFSFILHCNTPREFLLNIRKLKFLRRLTYPLAQSREDFTAIQQPIFRFTLGDMYVNLGGFLNTLTISPQDNGAWETEAGFKHPRIIRCSLSFKVIHDEMPMAYKSDESYPLRGFNLGKFEEGLHNNVDRKLGLTTE